MLGGGAFGGDAGGDVGGAAAAGSGAAERAGVAAVVEAAAVGTSALWTRVGGDSRLHAANGVGFGPQIKSGATDPGGGADSRSETGMGVV